MDGVDTVHCCCVYRRDRVVLDGWWMGLIQFTVVVCTVVID